MAFEDSEAHVPWSPYVLEKRRGKPPWLTGERERERERERETEREKERQRELETKKGREIGRASCRERV